jgi:ElaB/YqjD/DUF883 family membrane-anchored ribosome-binding protein
MSTMTDRQRERLAEDLRNVIHDAEELLKLTAQDVGDEAAAVRERVRSRLLDAKDSLLQLQEGAVERAKEAGRKADDYVHDHPWQAIGIAGAVGVVVGLLIGRR